MAASVKALSLGSFVGSDATQKMQRVYFQVTATGNYPGTPGDTLDLTPLGAISGYPPLLVDISSQNPAGASGYQYEYNPGATTPTQANGKFQVLASGASGAPNADIGAVAYPAGVLNDVIVGFADFIRL